MHRMRLGRASLCAVAAVVLAGVAGAAPAQAEFGLSAFDGAVLDGQGERSPRRAVIPSPRRSASR